MLSACQKQEEQTASEILLGYIGPLTGDIAAIGSDSSNAVRLAVDEFNEAGGLDGAMVKLIPEDGRCAGAESANAAQKLVNVDGVKFIIGGGCSGETLAAAPIAEEKGVILLSPFSSSPDVTDAGDFVFRTYPSDAGKGVALANIFAEKKLARVAIISENTDFCQGIVRAVTDSLSDGTEVVFSEFVEPGTTDYRSLLSRLKDMEFDVFIVNTQSEKTGAALLTQFRELGMTQPAYGTDTTDTAAMFDLASGALDNFFAVSVPILDESSDFATKFTAKFGAPQFGISYAAHSYDAAVVLLNAIKEVGAQPAAVRDAFYAMPAHEGASGTFTFDDNGDAEGFEFAVKQFKDGTISEVERVSLD